jgi:CheY-like chemotaxis protein
MSIVMLPAATPPLVLIVDDNRDTCEMYASYLPTVGYSVETAADGREAVIKALTLHPDVIVMDLQMPGVNGWRAMREIRGQARTATTPIIVLTGHDFRDYLGHSAIAEGAWSYLVKPCLPERLAHEISVRLSEPDIRTAHVV